MTLLTMAILIFYTSCILHILYILQSRPDSSVRLERGANNAKVCRATPELICLISSTFSKRHKIWHWHLNDATFLCPEETGADVLIGIYCQRVVSNA